MTIEERIEGDIVVMRLAGDFWSTGDWMLYDKIKEHTDKGHNKYILDFNAITRINSMGIGVVVASLKTAQEAGGGLRFVGVNKAIKDVLAVVNLYTILEFDESVEEALHAFTAS